MRFPKRVFVFCLGAAALLAACHRPGAEQAALPVAADTAWAAMQLHIYHGRDADTFLLNKSYTLGGQKLTAQRVQYYLSNPVLIDSAGERVRLGAWYRLISMGNPASWSLALPRIPAGRYQALELMLGIDSAQSASLDQSGDLAPDSGMYWGWSTGYIHAKAEGLMGRNGAYFSWHVGGTTAPTANQRLIRLNLHDGAGLFSLGREGKGHVRMQVDVAHLFEGPITLATEPEISDAVTGSALADQWQGIFGLDTAWVE